MPNSLSEYLSMGCHSEWCYRYLACSLRYPHCLHFLDLLQEESFRRDIANGLCTKFIEEQQLLHWHHYTKKRTQFAQKIQQKKGGKVTIALSVYLLLNASFLLS